MSDITDEPAVTACFHVASPIERFHRGWRHCPLHRQTTQWPDIRRSDGTLKLLDRSSILEDRRRMRFSYAEAMTDPSYYIPLAKAAEAAGYASMTIPDSVAYPFESDSTYPYTPDGNREFLDGKAFIETFVLTAALGAVTSTLRFNFFVLKLPIRPPALVAKQAGSLAALIGNRVGLGVGTSPWPEDYELMGVPSPSVANALTNASRSSGA
jgi:alkanesulfonate monooxygenase SsuD/methylene tetrahydromethanopterin reductase-like flavin-dependent oxidoreductase (luciferase family)